MMMVVAVIHVSCLNGGFGDDGVGDDRGGGGDDGVVVMVTMSGEESRWISIPIAIVVMAWGGGRVVMAAAKIQ